jgi:hypothetical protein
MIIIRGKKGRKKYVDAQIISLCNDGGTLTLVNFAQYYAAEKRRPSH